MNKHSFLALDLGAESGRAILGSLENGKRLRIKEIGRFPNGMVHILGHWYWNIFRLFEEMKKVMKGCVSETNVLPESLALDTWGVDFALLASDGSILGLPYAYRDIRTEGAMEGFFEKISKERIYQLTGIQFLQFNTLYQLFAMKRNRSPVLDMASDLLFIPDLFNYLFTGEKRTEFTIATTSQLFNPHKQDWDEELFSALGISKGIMQRIVLSGAMVGNLNKTICQETGLKQMAVIAVASHDTGSAVASVPAEDEDFAFISSGTWSLIGIEIKNPIINEEALSYNFTNEGGVEGTFRFLKNIMGLWPLQESRKVWSNERLYDYDELTQMATKAFPFKAIINPDWQGFLNPADMVEAIWQFCRETKQNIPESPAEVVRCIYESLALKYRYVLEQLKQISPHPIRRIHIIGGGAQNGLLCQFTANATGLPVIAGPIEATAVGNMMVQARSLGYIDSLVNIRKIIAESFGLTKYEPQEAGEWNSAYERFQHILNFEAA